MVGGLLLSIIPSSLAETKDSEEVVESSSSALEQVNNQDTDLVEKAPSQSTIEKGNKNTEIKRQENSSEKENNSTDSPSEMQRDAEEKMDGKVIENGWTYYIKNNFAYITHCSLSGDVKVPSTLGGKSIRFDTLDYTVFSNYQNITSLEISDPFSAFYITFRYMDNLQSVNLNLINLEGKSTNSMFWGLGNLQSVNLNNFDASNISDMGNMFFNCASLTNIDVSKFNTANVTNMANMFGGCRSVTSLDLSGFNTANVTDMTNMFQSCESLTNLNITKFNTAKVTSMNAMFYHCKKLTDLNLSSFNTANVTDMAAMFSECNELVNLNIDVNKFDTSNV